MATRHYIYLEGQSNAVGFGTVGLSGAPAGLPEPLVTLFRRVNHVGPQRFHDTVQAALDTTNPTPDPIYWGVECQLGLNLLASGLDVTILKGCANGTSVLQWAPSAEATQYFGLARTALQGGRARTGDFSCHIVSIRGEFEALDSDPTGANNWASDYLNGIYAGVSTLFGVAPAVHMCRVRAALPGAPNISTVRAQQSLVTIQTGGKLYNTDALTTIDGTHYDPASINALGASLALGIRAEIQYQPSLVLNAA